MKNDAPSSSAETAEELMMLFRRVAKLMVRGHHHGRGHALHAQAHVLALLRERGPMSQRDMLELLNVRSASLSEVLTKLERQELISRARSEQDKRNFIIEITESGNNAAENHKKEFLYNAETIFAPLSQEERGQLGVLLGKVISSMEQETEEHDGHRRGHRHCGHGEHRFEGKLFGKRRRQE